LAWLWLGFGLALAWIWLGAGILLGLLDPRIRDREVVTKRRRQTANLLCVTFQKNANLAANVVIQTVSFPSKCLSRDINERRSSNCTNCHHHLGDFFQLCLLFTVYSLKYFSQLHSPYPCQSRCTLIQKPFLGVFVQLKQ